VLGRLINSGETRASLRGIVVAPVLLALSPLLAQAQIAPGDVVRL
jgi:hypothetical protein